MDGDTIRVTVDADLLHRAQVRIIANGVQVTRREAIEHGLSLILAASDVDLPVGVAPDNHPAKIKEQPHDTEH